MHLVEFDDLNAGGRADGLNGLAIGLDPVIDRRMTAVQESTNGTKTQAFKVKLERLPFNCWMDASVTDRMPIATALTVVRCLPFAIPSLVQPSELHWGYLTMITDTDSLKMD
jgi:hypothetical protein